MKRLLPAALLAMVLTAQAGGPDGPVTVEFLDPRQYVDIGRLDAERNLRVLADIVRTEAGACLEPGEALHVVVQQIDLAGDDEWWHRGAVGGLRVMRTHNWPRIDLQYVLSDAAGQVLRDGEANVRDMNYLSRSARVRFDRDPLPYERAMLRDWFRRQFCDAHGYAPVQN